MKKILITYNISEFNELGWIEGEKTKIIEILG